MGPVAFPNHPKCLEFSISDKVFPKFLDEIQPVMSRQAFRQTSSVGQVSAFRTILTLGCVAEISAGGPMPTYDPTVPNARTEPFYDIGCKRSILREGRILLKNSS